MTHTKDEWVNSVMEQAQVFASAWSLVGSRFDSGNGLENAEEEKKALRAMLTTPPAQPAPVQDIVPPAQEARAWLDERGKHELASAVSNLIIEYRKAVHEAAKNGEKSCAGRIDIGLCGGAQPAPVPLSLDQISKLIDNCKSNVEGEFLVELIRAAEAAHGITKGGAA